MWREGLINERTGQSEDRTTTFKEIQFTNRSLRTNDFGISKIENMVTIPRMKSDGRFGDFLFGHTSHMFLDLELKNMFGLTHVTQTTLTRNMINTPPIRLMNGVFQIGKVKFVSGSENYPKIKTI